MKLVKVSDLFDINYGNSLTLSDLEQKKATIPFVSRTEKNNGISAKVKLIKNIKLNSKDTISVATGGSVMSSFLQKEPYYTGYHILILQPKIKLTDIEMLFYCMCLKANKYKYNFGRQANKTLKEIQIPTYESIPKWVYETKIPKLIKKPLINKRYDLGVDNWKSFRLKDLFEISKGKPIHRNTIKNHFHKNKKDFIPYVTRTTKNNGIELYIHKDEINQNNYIDGNVITIGGEGFKAFYQKNKFVTGNNLNILQLDNLNIYLALFINNILNLEIEKKFNYGRGVVKFRLEKLSIKLPSKNHQPNWQFMENYIKSLSYSNNIMAKGT